MKKSVGKIAKILLAAVMLLLLNSCSLFTTTGTISAIPYPATTISVSTQAYSFYGNNTNSFDIRHTVCTISGGAGKIYFRNDDTVCFRFNGEESFGKYKYDSIYNYDDGTGYTEFYIFLSDGTEIDGAAYIDDAHTCPAGQFTYNGTVYMLYWNDSDLVNLSFLTDGWDNNDEKTEQVRTFLEWTVNKYSGKADNSGITEEIKEKYQFGTVRKGIFYCETGKIGDNCSMSNLNSFGLAEFDNYAYTLTDNGIEPVNFIENGNAIIEVDYNNYKSILIYTDVDVKQNIAWKDFGDYEDIVREGLESILWNCSNGLLDKIVADTNNPGKYYFSSSMTEINSSKCETYEWNGISFSEGGGLHEGQAICVQSPLDAENYRVIYISYDHVSAWNDTQKFIQYIGSSFDYVDVLGDCYNYSVLSSFDNTIDIQKNGVQQSVQFNINQNCESYVWIADKLIETSEIGVLTGHNVIIFNSPEKEDYYKVIVWGEEKMISSDPELLFKALDGDYEKANSLFDCCFYGEYVLGRDYSFAFECDGAEINLNYPSDFAYSISEWNGDNLTLLNNLREGKAIVFIDYVNWIWNVFYIK